MPRPDYSLWLTPARLAVEETAWEHAGFHHGYAAAIVGLNPRRVLELGCGTGWVPMCLSGDIVYVGVDANPHCIDLAHVKNPGRRFIEADIRTFVPNESFDLVCAFAVLKHFGLEEWPQIVARMLSMAPAALFTVPVGAEDRDTGTEWPHVWVTEATMRAAVSAAGHTVVSMTGGIEPYIVTARRQSAEVAA